MTREEILKKWAATGHEKWCVLALTRPNLDDVLVTALERAKDEFDDYESRCPKPSHKKDPEGLKRWTSATEGWRRAFREIRDARYDLLEEQRKRRPLALSSDGQRRQEDLLRSSVVPAWAVAVEKGVPPALLIGATKKFMTTIGLEVRLIDAELQGPAKINTGGARLDLKALNAI